MCDMKDLLGDVQAPSRIESAVRGVSSLDVNTAWGTLCLGGSRGACMHRRTCHHLYICQG